MLAGLLRMHVGDDQYELGPGDLLAFPADSPALSTRTRGAPRPVTTTS